MYYGLWYLDNIYITIFKLIDKTTEKEMQL